MPRRSVPLLEWTAKHAQIPRMRPEDLTGKCTDDLQYNEFGAIIAFSSTCFLENSLRAIMILSKSLRQGHRRLAK